jgi:anti-sigma regulatory factor (Ser/Thr protein kinase)
VEVGSYAAQEADDGPDWAADECVELTDALASIRSGRRFVVDRVRAGGVDALVDDAALIAAELLANARQHGAPPIVVCVRADGDRVRLEVRDEGPHAPIMPPPSTNNMTGRGLTLVAALSNRWGIRRTSSGGKSVWCELVVGHQPRESETPQPVLDFWDEDAEAASDRFTVVLGDVPTELLLEAKAHIDNLVREFSLAASAGETGDAVVPEHLARLIESVVSDFADARVAIKRQALAAAQRGEPRTRLVLNLLPEAAEAGERYLAALDEADEYARAARLLTLETPFDHRLFRRWYVQAVVQQLRELGAGRQATAVPAFEQVLVSEIRKLAMAQRMSERSARLQRATAALARTRTPEDVASVGRRRSARCVGRWVARPGRRRRTSRGPRRRGIRRGAGGPVPGRTARRAASGGDRVADPRAGVDRVAAGAGPALPDAARFRGRDDRDVRRTSRRR